MKVTSEELAKESEVEEHPGKWPYSETHAPVAGLPRRYTPRNDGKEERSRIQQVAAFFEMRMKEQCPQRGPSEN